MEEFSRTELLIKKEGIESLQNSTVAIFGVGGVGGFVVEALARAGVGTLHIIDHDTVSISNLNRQIIATHQTIDRKKVDVMKERILSINPYCNVKIYDDKTGKWGTAHSVHVKRPRNSSPDFFLPETANHFPFDEFDYIVDAVDTVTAKIKLVEISQEKKIPIISSMGTGNKLDPTKLEVTDIYKTSICPLARVMRRELKKRKIPALKVVYSTEKPIETDAPVDPETHKKTPGSISFVPSCAGLIIASVVVRDLLHIK